MEKRKWNYKKIINEIKNNGYFVYKNFLQEQELKEIKNSLLYTLNYIKKSKEKNLIKK